jgi:hypothetical protein
MKYLIAQARNGSKVKCEVNIDERGNIATEYPIVFAKNGNLQGYSLELTKKQAEKIFNRKFPVTTINIMLENDEDWYEIKKQAKKINSEYKKMIAEKIWNKMLKNNDELELWQAFNSGGETIIGLPEILEDKKKLLLKILDFDWDSKQDKFLLTITAKDLLALIENAEKEKLECNEKRISNGKKQMTAKEERELIKQKLFDAEADEIDEAERYYLGLDCFYELY